MPGFDGTGPMGQGALTGRGLGPCGGGMAYGRRGGGGFGRGFGRGLGLGRGRYWGYRANPVTKKEETEMLSQEAGILEEELKAIKSRLAEVKNQK